MLVLIYYQRILNYLLVEQKEIPQLQLLDIFLKYHTYLVLVLVGLVVVVMFHIVL